MIRQLRIALLVTATSLMMNQAHAQQIEFNEIINEATMAQLEAARQVRSALEMEEIITSPFVLVSLEEIQKEVSVVLKQLSKKLKKPKRKARNIASL